MQSSVGIGGKEPSGSYGGKDTKNKISYAWVLPPVKQESRVNRSTINRQESSGIEHEQYDIKLVIPIIVDDIIPVK